MFRFRDRFRAVAVTAAVVITVASCGAPPPGESLPGTRLAEASTPEASLPKEPAAQARDEVAPDAPTRVRQQVEAETATAALSQPALWPSSDVVFDTPEQAAESFVSEVLGVEPVLGDFAAGDSRSGEISVFSPGEVEGANLQERGVLFLRILGPNDGWFVIGASSQGVTIESPDTLDQVPVGSLAVTGQGHGFEGTLVVTAFRAGDIDDVLDFEIARGGAFNALERYSATLDISGAAPGDVIALIVRGDTGLTGDPGDFTAITIVVAEPLPDTQ